MNIKYQESYPENPNDISPLLIGEGIPTVKIPAADGQLFDLNAGIAKQPAILMFYRGGWCPYCSLQLAGMQHIQTVLVEMGYQVIAIGTDSPANLRQSISENDIAYTLLSDADLAVSTQFGIVYQAPVDYYATISEGSAGKNIHQLLPVPSVFIVNRKGIIDFEYINPDFTKRIHTGLLQAAAKVLEKESHA